MAAIAYTSEVAEAGSQNMPSRSVSSFCAARISASLHSSNQPPDSLLAFHA